MGEIVTICKEARMAIAHRLPHHGGKCRTLHGHSYVVRLYISGPLQEIDEANPASGMVIDFGTAGDFLKSLEGRLDHQYANDAIDAYPTAERLAVAIMKLARQELAPALPMGVAVSKIRVYEEYVAPQAFAEVSA